MPVPFLLRVEAHEPDEADRIIGALRAALGPSRCRFEKLPRAAPGACVSAGVWDPEGRPRWLAPLPVGPEPEAAARAVVSFLESWGFIPRGGPGRAS